MNAVRLPRSLHARMLALSAAATLIALALAGWLIAGVLERFVVAGIDRRLDSEVALLAGAVSARGEIDRDRVRQQAGVLERERGWRWQIVTQRGTLGSGDLPPLGDAPAPPAPPGLHPPPGPAAPPERPERPFSDLQPVEGVDAQGGVLHARRVTLRTAGGPVTITAAAPRDVIRRPIRDAVEPLLLILAALGTLLGAVALVQLRVGLRPVRRLRDQVAAIRAGQRARVDEDQPSELRPLAVELNALAGDNAAALDTARRSAANMAHALKTPVAALSLALRGDPALAAQVARIDETIRHHLARARAQVADTRTRTPIAPALADLAHTIATIHRDAGVVIEQDLPSAPLAAAMDPRDLDELLGNLLDNAAKNAARRVVVRVRADTDARFVTITVSDDGPGIPAADRARAAQAGTRLDEQRDGHGFGLAIAVELAQLYGGTLALNEAAGGGLCVSLRLPGGAIG
ncbi:ATP-binding protein [Sphingomonas citricola]|uniref:ATP-binding protein n=1 Tax=Sphingomonas citricola TaxID=2862498 RepID=UPI00215615F1|nr:HAMP domain-containing sensor histidine kinase [Sphingomonas citricola]